MTSKLTDADFATAVPPMENYPVLRGQKVLVTGASSGIGKGIALSMGQAGADVLVNYNSNAESARQVAAAIEQGGTRAIVHQANVCTEQQVMAMFERMRAEFGRIDILVNNAGLQRDANVDEMTLEQWNTVIQVNLTGPFLCAREAIRHFKCRAAEHDGPRRSARSSSSARSMKSFPGPATSTTRPARAGWNC